MSDTAAARSLGDRGGQMVGPYRLCFEIAAGGMAKVYLAVKEGPSGFTKLVAIKLIHDHLVNETEFVEMFLDEARIASRISHPSVCSVIDFGEAHGTYFLAMEHLAGDSLRQVHRALANDSARRSSPRNALIAARIIADVCEGLHAAHELRDTSGALLHVVHRDVSPQNVFVTYEGSVKVMDFGIATARDRVHHTATGTVKGKFAYMAPEQIRGQAVDRRADIWALGLLLWESVALKRMFGRSNEAETALAVLSDPVISLSSYLKRDLSELDRIIGKALERDPERRYATAREMGRDLTRYLATCGEVIDSVAIAEWMTGLFPGGAQQKQQLVRLSQPDQAIPKAYGDRDSASLSRVASEVRERQRASSPHRRLTRAQLAAAIGVAVLGVITIGAAAGWALSAPPDAAPNAPSDAAPAAVAESAPARPAAEPPAPQPLLAAAASSPAPLPEPPPTPAVPNSTPPARVTAPRAPAAAAAPGFVDIATPGGWATVNLGRRALGTTPGRFALPPGRHRLQLAAFGGARRQAVTVEVRSGETSRVRVELQR